MGAVPFCTYVCVIEPEVCKPTEHTGMHTSGSFGDRLTGKTAGFGPAILGSNPSPRAYGTNRVRSQKRSTRASATFEVPSSLQYVKPTVLYS